MTDTYDVYDQFNDCCDIVTGWTTRGQAPSKQEADEFILRLALFFSYTPTKTKPVSVAA